MCPLPSRWVCDRRRDGRVRVGQGCGGGRAGHRAAGWGARTELQQRVVVQQRKGAKRRWIVKGVVHPSVAHRGERFERSDSECIDINCKPPCMKRVCNGHIMQRQASGGHSSKRPPHGCRWRPKNSRRRCKADGVVKKNHVPAERGERSAHARGRSRKTRFFEASMGLGGGRRAQWPWSLSTKKPALVQAR